MEMVVGRGVKCQLKCVIIIQINTQLLTRLKTVLLFIYY